MKSFKQFVNEARRNPELNPKVGATDYLRKYKDRDDIYISFTKVDKLGVNPQSSFNTPIGVYTYPLKEFWKYYKVEKYGSVKHAAPFAGDSPYIQILKGKHSKGFFRDFSKYTERDLEKDKQKILSIAYKKGGSDSQLKVFPFFEYAEESSSNKTPFGKIWNITRIMSGSQIARDLLDIRSKKSAIAWNELFQKMGYTGFSDETGTGIIFDAEPVQAVFFTAKEYTQIDAVQNKEYDNPNPSYRTNTGLDWTGGTWNGGNWKDGTWCGGRWKQGVWNCGTWKKGVWEDGIFEAGTWESGTWKKGSFMWAKWLDGTWENGTWIGGTWENGTWKNGEWCNGAWKNGTWRCGIWSDGSWYNGTWCDGDWCNGIWNNGTWNDGIWWQGEWCGGTWKDGKWYKGGIYSKKYKRSICSSVNPKAFCRYETETSYLEELKSKVK
jgi:hypothetical protein